MLHYMDEDFPLPGPTSPDLDFQLISLVGQEQAEGKRGYYRPLARFSLKNVLIVVGVMHHSSCGLAPPLALICKCYFILLTDNSTRESLN